MSNIYHIKILIILIIPILMVLIKSANADCLPDFCLKNAKQKLICKKDLKGQQVLVDFWASWCPNCATTMQHLADKAKLFTENSIRVIALNLDQQIDDAENFLKEHPTPLEVVFDSEGKIAESCSLESLPATILFAADGSEKKRWYGSSIAVQEEIDQLLKSK